MLKVSKFHTKQPLKRLDSNFYTGREILDILDKNTFERLKVSKAKVIFHHASAYEVIKSQALPPSYTAL